MCRSVSLAGQVLNRAIEGWTDTKPRLGLPNRLSCARSSGIPWSGVLGWKGDMGSLSAAAFGRPRKCAVKFLEQRFIVFIVVPTFAYWIQAVVKPDE